MGGNNNIWQTTGRYLGFAFLLPLCTAVGYIVGQLLDRALGTTYLYIVFLLLGIAAGFLQLYRELMKDSEKP